MERYTAEFIKNLPESMRAEVATLNSQIDTLEKKRAEVQLPLDVVVSFDALVKNRADAEAAILEGKAKAAEIIESAKIDAAALIEKAKVSEAESGERATILLEAAESKKAEVEAKIAELAAEAKSLAGAKDKFAAERAAHADKVAKFHAAKEAALKALA